MPSPTDSPRGSEHFGVRWERWNRRLHYYAGLFFLLFLLLFAVTGLLLNHPNWAVADSWSKRREQSSEHSITPFGPELLGDLAQAQDIIRQLGIEGEILWTTTRTDGGQFDFQVRRPGHFYFIKADLTQNRILLRHSTVNVWGAMKALHVFSGLQLEDTKQRRDWVLTSVWAFSMNVVAAGLILMVVSGLHMWWRVPQKRLVGAAVLGVGTVVCAFFCFGLRLLF